MMNKKLEAVVKDLAGSLMYYDRKECEDFPVGLIEAMIANHETSIDEIVEVFRLELEK